jgi:hypothetical protein
LPAALAVAFSTAEILRDFFRLCARLAEGDPSVLREHQLLALQQDLGTALGRDISSIRTLVGKDELVLAPLDGAVVP